MESDTGDVRSSGRIEMTGKEVERLPSVGRLVHPRPHRFAHRLQADDLDARRVERLAIFLHLRSRWVAAIDRTRDRFRRFLHRGDTQLLAIVTAHTGIVGNHVCAQANLHYAPFVPAVRAAGCSGKRIARPSSMERYAAST